ncbi:uncharacterized protein PG998_008283 [Apiospora kogelbergensis]|uniref:uncharacterized protein n=1 Tax=Apiospora kogelbergensis TaxID=1337665 RepID=UPI00312FCED3
MVLQELELLSCQYGCEPPPLLQNQRPFGLDRLEQIFRADSESRLMELFLFHFRQTGWTLKQEFLCTPAYGTVDPENMEAILSSKFHDFDNGPRRDVTFPMFGDGIFTQDGEPWRKSRDMLRPQLFHRHYEDLEVFKTPLDDLLEALPRSGVVDLQPLFFRLTLDVTTAFLFGESVHSLRSTTHRFADAFDAAQQIVTKRFRLQDMYWLIGGKSFHQACDEVRQFADEIIDQNLAKKETPGRSKFLQSVAKETEDRTALRGQIINILTAGRDTTACLLSWVFFLLVRHPAVMKKLREEVDHLSTLGGQLERSHLRDAKYLQSVMKETLRLYPSVPVNTRNAVRTTVLPTGGGPDRKSPILIPKGSSVAFSVYTMHRRPDLFGMDAELFRPERWDEDMPINHNPIHQKWGYIPFSAGPRTCLGLDFALTEAAYAVVRIMQKYPSIRLPKGEAVDLTGVEKQKMTLVLQIKDGCKVELEST